MGLLAIGSPLDWAEAKQHADHVREHGIEQFLHIWHRLKDRTGDVLLWGDEVSPYSSFRAARLLSKAGLGEIELIATWPLRAASPTMRYRSSTWSSPTTTRARMHDSPCARPRSWTTCSRMLRSARRRARGGSASCSLDSAAVQAPTANAFFCRECIPVFHPEYGRYMLESTPGAPYGANLEALLSVEGNMKFR